MDDPVRYTVCNANSTQHAADILSKYKNLFRWSEEEEEDVLEIGCAGGAVTREVLFPFVEANARRLLATDLSDEAVEFAKERNANPKISFEQLNITDEGQCERYAGKFHHIFAFYCFPLIRETDSWSRNVSKMLKPNGQLFTYMIVNDIFLNEISRRQRADATKPWWRYIADKPDQFVSYGPDPMETVAKILEKVGLRVETVDLETKRHTYPDINDAKGTLSSVTPYSKLIPEGMRESYMEDYLEKAMEYVKVNENGDHFYSFDVLIVLATKP